MIRAGGTTTIVGSESRCPKSGEDAGKDRKSLSSSTDFGMLKRHNKNRRRIDVKTTTKFPRMEGI